MNIRPWEMRLVKISIIIWFTFWFISVQTCHRRMTRKYEEVLNRVALLEMLSEFYMNRGKL